MRIWRITEACMNNSKKKMMAINKITKVRKDWKQRKWWINKYTLGYISLKKKNIFVMDTVFNILMINILSTKLREWIRNNVVSHV